MAKRRIERRLTKTGRDQITGEYVTEQLDAVHRAKLVVVAALDGQMLKLDAAARYRLADELEEVLRAMRPHTGGEGVVFGGGH